jgi:16S rRNA (guanine966-N2)-methyltransferase
VRIIAGEWRGRTLTAPPGGATRPTADRLRQTLFDMLLHAPWGGRELLDGAHVLDAFAGTGALGLEALSRGATSASFIERDRAALGALRANIAACRAGTRCGVTVADTLKPPLGKPSRLVFLDPPYGQDLLPRAIAALARAGWIAADTLVIAESARDEKPALGHLLAERAHGAGRITVWVAKPASAS